MHKITLYTKPHCTLCDAARHTISNIITQRAAIIFEIIDITSDAALNEKYRNDIPVVFMDGKEAFRHTIDPDRLARMIMDEPGENLLGIS